MTNNPQRRLDRIILDLEDLRDENRCSDDREELDKLIDKAREIQLHPGDYD